VGNINQISFVGWIGIMSPKERKGRNQIPVNFEDKFRLTQEEEVDPLCGAVCQRRFQPLVKARC
jgi:hypothetical protein